MSAENILSPREARIPWAAMAGIIATVTVFAVAQGLTYPLLSFILERQGTTSVLIGLSAAMTPLGFIISAPFIPALSRHLGGARLAILCSILAALTLISIGWTQNDMVLVDPSRSAKRPSRICITALPAMKQVMSEAMRCSALPSAAP